MRSSKVLLWSMVYLLTVHGCSCSECIIRMQNNCRDENEALIDAEQQHNVTKLCFYLSELFKCVARMEHSCLEVAMETLAHHTHSPHGCILDEKLVIELQQIGQNASEAKETTTGHPETSSSTYETSPATVAIVTNKTDSLHTGSKEEHTGSKTHNSATSGKKSGLYIHILTALGLTLASFMQRNILS